MKQTLTDDLLTVEISSRGAELQSILNNRTRHQYLWQGDPRYWSRRSPVLFPVVGALWQGELRMDGQTYRMSQHGFARDMEFTPVADTPDDEAWFALESSAGTLARYPRRFRLEIGYRLQGERLTVLWHVTNLDDKPMDFQIGAHPAFNYPAFNPSDPLHGYFMFDARRLSRQTITDGGCVGPEESPVVLDDDRMLPVSASTFASDAIILAGSQIRRVSMLTPGHRPYLSMLFDAPVVGLWSPKPDAPFVCIEPWWGRADSVGFDGDFSRRPYVNTLQPGRSFSASCMIIFEDL